MTDLLGKLGIENRRVDEVSEKELIKPKRISEEEKARLEEFRSLFNLKLG